MNRILVSVAIILSATTAYAAGKVQGRAVNPDEATAEQMATDKAQQEADRQCRTQGGTAALLTKTEGSCYCDYHVFGCDETCNFSFECK